MIVAGRTAVLMPMMFILAGMPTLAQAAASAVAITQQPAESPAASFAFDVATIKPSDPSVRGSGGGFEATGYHITNYPLFLIVLTAYLPSSKGNDVRGMPAWAMNERYDIVAHIDEATAPSWLKLNPLQWQQAGRPMLQKLLAERCKLVAHTVPAETDGYVLVVSKRGSRLTPSKPGAIYPSSAKNGPDGLRTLTTSSGNTFTESFFNATTEQLADRISGAGWVIVDQTHLTGRYDFTFRRLELPRDADGNRIADPQPSDLWDISSTGLEFKRAKIPSENLVIDHIERPSPN